MPSRWAVVMISSHWRVEIRPREMTSRTSSSRISADVPGKSPEAGVTQLAEILGDRHSGPRHAVQHLLGREGMDVQVRQRLVDRPAEVDVEAAVELRREPGLHAHLGRPEVPGFPCPADHLLEREEVALLLPVVSAEGAEGAVLDADVREVDVPVDDVGHHVARLPGPQLVGDQGQGAQLAPGRLGERQPIVHGDLAAVERPVEGRANAPVEARPVASQEGVHHCRVHLLSSRPSTAVRWSPCAVAVGDEPGRRPPARARGARRGPGTKPGR